MCFFILKYYIFLYFVQGSFINSIKNMKVTALNYLSKVQQGMQMKILALKM